MRAGQGRASDAIAWAERAIVEAEAVGEREALANAHYMIAWSNVSRGVLGQDDHFERALSIFEDLGNVKRQGDVLTYFGAMAVWEGRWDDAVELHERGRERSVRAGDVVGAAIASMNIAEIRSDQGRLEEAEGPLRDALRVFRAAHYPELVSMDCSILGRMLSRSGQHDEATRLLSEAVEQADLADAKLIKICVLGFLAEDLTRRENADEALACIERAYDQARPIGGPGGYEPLLERVRGEALMLRGDLDNAADALERGLAAARAGSAELELMLILRSRRALSVRRGEPASPSENAEADTIAERLGIVSAPDASLTSY